MKVNIDQTAEVIDKMGIDKIADVEVTPVQVGFFYIIVTLMMIYTKS